MTQPPTTPDGAPEPSPEPTPTFGGTPPPPPPQAAYGAQTYTPPPEHKNRKKWGIFGGIGAIAVIILVKILIGLGLGEAAHKVEHRADDAEKVVNSALVAENKKDFLANFVPGTKFGSAFDKSCANALKNGSLYKVPKSSKNDDGSADVTVDLQDSKIDMHFHLVDKGGWKIQSVTCD